MVNVILIRGNSGSGKSSLAKCLQATLGPKTMLLSQDYLRRTVLASKDDPNTPTIPLILAMLEAGKELCEVIILEGILRADWYKPVWHYLQHDFPGQVLAYYYDLAFEETLRRHHSRDLVSAFGADRMKECFVPQDFLKEIPEKSLGANLSLHEAQAIILNDLQQPSLSQVMDPIN